MLKVYINYPNPHITVHSDGECPRIQQQHKQRQRIVRLDVATLSAELKRFMAKNYRFGSAPDTNDMWLDVDLGDPVFERAVVEFVQKLLAQHYDPFGRIKVDQHC
jgi:hypothetical protein